MRLLAEQSGAEDDESGGAETAAGSGMDRLLLVVETLAAPETGSFRSPAGPGLCEIAQDRARAVQRPRHPVVLLRCPRLIRVANAAWLPREHGDGSATRPSGPTSRPFMPPPSGT
jgi:hypothetical protein